MSKRRKMADQPVEDDLFSLDPASYVQFGLSRCDWPDQTRFPVNHSRTHVRDVVEPDLVSSDDALLVAGYSSVGALIDLVARWGRERGDRQGQVRLLLGSEPFPSQRASFGSGEETFTEDVRGYWLAHGVSVSQSAKVIRALEQLDNGSLSVRIIPGPPPLHAKIYVGDTAATVGSSNYTDYGMARQLEANARFERLADPARFSELKTIGENLWSHGRPWEDEFRRLLRDLLQVVSWQEALARACAELLEGEWAGNLLESHPQRAQLWPSQALGIAQALWVVENLGSVLIADATGSGKTRMGAHLVAAVRDRLLDTGRMRRDRDLVTLVCPPAVLETWQVEALTAGVTIMPVSHGLLSRSTASGPRVEASAVARAQVLAVDEAHNFLTAESNRTRHVRDTVADHVLLFTATPISRGAQDLLSLVGLLGADNFDDETLEVLESLDRGVPLDLALSEQQRDRLRREIQGFTVRRTKSALNELVSRDEDSYRDRTTNRVCRYPVHLAQIYATGESAADAGVAEQIRRAADDLRGLRQLGRQIAPPAWLRGDVDDERWLVGRLQAARGLARHNVLSAMRSSRAALFEHLAGTAAAIESCKLPPAAKIQPSGDLIGKVEQLAPEGPPTVELNVDLPPWLQDEDAWRHECAAEADLYRRILQLTQGLGDSREQVKADLLRTLATQHRLVLAFDRHPITLAAIEQHLSGSGTAVIIATGQDGSSRKRVEKLFARDSSESAIALCSEALNEGLNLQGAGALVHLDLPTTLRVAEQRVGRLDRMDSPHDEISVWWPEDGPRFATRQIEVLLARRQASESLLGSNLPMPEFAGQALETVVPVRAHIRDLEQDTPSWDGIHDALDPVRALIDGDDALVLPSIYAAHRHTRHRVLARVAPVSSAIPWAFLALSGTQHGAPRWLMLEGSAATVATGVEAVADRLRARLRDNPRNVGIDEQCELWLDRFLDAAARAEHQLLPRRMQRALAQMSELTTLWAAGAANAGDLRTSQRWRRLQRVAEPGPDDQRLDPYVVGEVWWDLVRPRFADLPRNRRRRRYTRLRDLDPLLRNEPLDIDAVEHALRRAPIVEPVGRRVTAVILGVPDPALPDGPASGRVV